MEVRAGIDRAERDYRDRARCNCRNNRRLISGIYTCAARIDSRAGCGSNGSVPDTIIKRENPVLGEARGRGAGGRGGDCRARTVRYRDIAHTIVERVNTHPRGGVDVGAVVHVDVAKHGGDWRVRYARRRACSPQISGQNSCRLATGTGWIAARIDGAGGRN